MKLGNEVLSEVEKDFEGIHSPSVGILKAKKRFLFCNAKPVRNIRRVVAIWGRYSEIWNPKQEQVCKYRKILNNHNFSNFQEYTQELMKIVQKELLANCREMSCDGRLRLYNRGEKPSIIGVDVFDKITDEHIGEHSFSVFGLKNDAIIEKPKTWGEDAVVVDSWVGFALPAKEALKKLKIVLSGDDKSVMKYENMDNWFPPLLSNNKK